MNWFLRGLFQPTDNRHWIGSKLHAAMYAVYNIPILIVIGVLYIFNPSYQLIVGGLILVLFTVLDYFLFDRMLDKLLWKYIFKRHYEHNSPLTPEEHHLIKKYESDPSPENLQALQGKLKK